MSIKELQQSAMMAHLIRALDEGKSIGHYGRLVFTMVVRHFIHERQVIAYLFEDPQCSRAIPTPAMSTEI